MEENAGILDYSKIKNFCLSKDTVSKSFPMKGHPLHKMGADICNTCTQPQEIKVFLSRINKQLHTSIRKGKTPIENEQKIFLAGSHKRGYPDGQQA